MDKKQKIKSLSAIELAEELFKIHIHAELVTPAGIVYKEEDLIKFLKRLGYPEPDWEGNVEKMNKNGCYYE